MKLNKFIAAAVLVVVTTCAFAAAPASDAAKVVATQGGVQLTLGDIDTFTDTLPPEHRVPFFNSSKRIATLVGKLLVEKQQAAAARTQGLDKTVTGVVTDASLAKAEIDQFRASIKLPDFSELAREQFLSEPEKYDIPAKLSLQRILVTSTVRGEEQAAARIEEARQKAVKNPATFDALVDEYSDAASEKGNHGYIANADHILDPTLSSAVQALAKVGDISPSIKSADGYSVLKLVEKQPSRSQKFEDVRESIIESLKTRYINDAVANHIAEFSNKPVDADTAVMDTLRTRYGQVAAIPAIAPSVPTEK